MIVLVGDIHAGDAGALERQAALVMALMAPDRKAHVIVVADDTPRPRDIALSLVDVEPLYVVPPPRVQDRPVPVPGAAPSPPVESVRAIPRLRSERRVPLEQYPGSGPALDIEDSTNRALAQAGALFVVGGWMLAIVLALSVASVQMPDVVFVPTPEHVVEEMLDVAKVGPGDVVYDLGCGDGRMVIAAALRGARAVGVDIDPERVAEARENARRAGVADRVDIRLGDLFTHDFADATVVLLYLLPELNLRLRPRLLELRPGTRVVSHAFDMGDWKPDAKITLHGGWVVYFWTVPRAG